MSFISGGARDPQTIPPKLAAALQLAAQNFASDVHLRVGQSPWLRSGSTFAACSDEIVTPQEYEAVCDWIGEPHKAYTLELYGSRWRSLIFDGGIAIRRLAMEPPTWEMLGLPEIVRGVTSFSEGLVVFAGSTGSGKSSSIAALLSDVVKVKPVHVLTIEDPIEYLLTGKQQTAALVTQQHIAQERHEQALEDALRADPDIVMFGECRVPAHFDLCLTLAATGHLVFTTIHAGSATSVCERVIAASGDVGHSLLASTLRAVVCQRLIPNISDPKVRHCAAEILMVDSNMLPTIRPSGDLGLLQAKISDTPYSMERSLAALVKNGHISASAAYRAANDRIALEQLL